MLLRAAAEARRLRASGAWPKPASELLPGGATEGVDAAACTLEPRPDSLSLALRLRAPLPGQGEVISIQVH